MDIQSEEFKILRKRARAQLDRNHNLINQLTKIRAKKKITQEEIAFRLGVTQPAISALETGNSDPQIGTLSRYATAMGVVISYTVSDCENQEDVQWEDSSTFATTVVEREKVKPRIKTKALREGLLASYQS